MLLLGVLQAQAAGAAPAGVPAFDLLETQVLASSAASVTFSSLSTYAADYQHLQIRMVARLTSNESGAGAFSIFRFNGDSGAFYTAHNLYGNGSSVTSNRSGTTTSIALQRLPDGGATASAFGAIVIDILDPFSANKNTTSRHMAGYANNTPYIWFSSGAYFKTDALTSIFLQPGVGGDYAIGSRFSLYGIKAGA